MEINEIENRETIKKSNEKIKQINKPLVRPRIKEKRLKLLKSDMLPQITVFCINTHLYKLSCLVDARYGSLSFLHSEGMNHIVSVVCFVLTLVENTWYVQIV